MAEVYVLLEVPMGPQAANHSVRPCHKNTSPKFQLSSHMDPPVLERTDHVFITSAMFLQLQEDIDLLRHRISQQDTKIGQQDTIIGQLRRENTKLRRENSELRRLIENMQKDIADNRRRIRELKKDEDVTQSKAKYNRSLVSYILSIF